VIVLLLPVRDEIERRRDGMKIAEFQQMIRERYYETDSARGAPGTFLWLTEEFGELAQAIAERERGDGDQVNLEEEFADVLAWLATMANITGVDLEQAIVRKYISNGGPEGTK
jgi:NTP pyrophosphatase (non-canonical NTP hydrolase)